MKISCILMMMTMVTTTLGESAESQASDNSLQPGGSILSETESEDSLESGEAQESTSTSEATPEDSLGSQEAQESTSTKPQEPAITKGEENTTTPTPQEENINTGQFKTLEVDIDHFGEQITALNMQLLHHMLTLEQTLTYNHFSVEDGIRTAKVSGKMQWEDAIEECKRYTGHLI